MKEKQRIISQIKELKKYYHKKGFIIIGIFGSYARGEQTEESDVDILYEIENNFYDRYPGWGIYPEIEKINSNIASKLNKKVDLANIKTLNEIGKKYILSEVEYV